MQNRDHNPKNPKKRNKWLIMLRTYGLPIIIIFIILVGTSYTNKLHENTSNDPKQISYVEFSKMVNDGKIEKISVNFTADTFTAIDKDNNKLETQNPKYDNFKYDLLSKNVEVEEIHSTKLLNIFMIIAEISFIGFLIYYLSKTMRVSSNKSTKIIKQSKVTFKDVAGLEPVKDDLNGMVDFLKNKKKYTDKGAKLPKGAILWGPPGTGKTLLAKAIAGEAKVPFFSASGSEFVEMYVGKGAQRVRELFAEARKNAPCIIFIDEIDALGKARGTSSGGGNNEYEQTLNQLLTEMDGFSGQEGILVFGATNRLDTLDDALLRPGRFDKHICVPLPSTPEERFEIINLYAKNKNFADDVDLKNLSKETFGYSPADIEVLLNEATIISVQLNKDLVDKECLDKAIFQKLLKGHAKKDKNRDESEKTLVAWHEAGHALVGKLLGMDIPKVTITPSTSGAGGVTLINNTKMGLYSTEELESRVKMTYGGNVAEFKLLKDRKKVTTGASQDIKDATNNIYNMITSYGMTEEFGLLNLNILNIDNKIILDEAKKISKRLYNETDKLLTENIDLLKEIAEELIKRESLTGDDLNMIINRDKIEESEVAVDVEKIEKINTDFEYSDETSINKETE